MSLSTAPIQDATGKPARRIAGPLKFALATAFLFLTGGPSVMAQFEENAASYWRQERQRMQARQPQQRPGFRSVEQRPTRLIRGAAPKKGFTRVVPEDPAPAATPAHPHTDGQPAEAPAPVRAAPATPQPATPAAAQTAATPVAGQPAPAVRIVVLGDNVGQLLARGLEMAFQETPQIAISRQTHDSSGLVNNRFFDWSDAVKKFLSGSEKVDIAVMMIGSNDAQEIQEGRERLRVRSDAWNKAYAQRIEAIATQFREKKVPLIWVGMPIMRGERLSAEMLAFNELYREAVQRAGGTYIDIWEAFVDDRNRFSLFGPDINGQIVKLRTGDGVHFTPAGARKLAYFLESNLKRLIEERSPRTDPVVAAVAPPGTATPAARPPVTPAAPAQTSAQTPGSAVKPAEQPAAPVIAALPPAPTVPQPMAAPARPAAGPVIRLTAPDVAGDGELVTSRRKPDSANPAQAAFLQRRLNDGAPIEAQRGRADDFSWPRR